MSSVLVKNPMICTSRVRNTKRKSVQVQRHYKLVIYNVCIDYLLMRKEINITQNRYFNNIFCFPSSILTFVLRFCFLLRFCFFLRFCFLLLFWQSLEEKKKEKEREQTKSYDPVRINHTWSKILLMVDQSTYINSFEKLGRQFYILIG